MEVDCSRDTVEREIFMSPNFKHQFDTKVSSLGSIYSPHSKERDECLVTASGGASLLTNHLGDKSHNYYPLLVIIIP